MYTEIKTSDKAELLKFVSDHAEDTQDRTIEIKKQNGKFVAQLFDANEPAT